MCKKNKPHKKRPLIRACETRYCINPATKGKYCHTCSSRRYRKRNPIRYAYSNHRSNAKRRGKIFEISYEYYKAFCIETDFIAGKGRTRESYSLDCINPLLGYVEGNLQKLPVWLNSKKSNRLEYDWQSKTATVVKSLIIDQSKNMF